MAELRVGIPNQQFQQMVIEAMMNEEVDDYVQLIVALVEEVAGEEGVVKDLIEIISNYLPAEGDSE